MDTLLQEVGDRITARRKQLRMTQEDLSEKAGVTAQTISNAELGKRRFGQRTSFGSAQLWTSARIIFFWAEYPQRTYPYSLRRCPG